MDKEVSMNEHAQKVLLFLKKGHAKEINPNASFKYRLIYIILFIVWFIISAVLLVSVVGWLVMSKFLDVASDLDDKYLDYVHKKGATLGKGDSLEVYNNAIPKDSFTKHSEIAVEIDLSKAGIIRLATKKPFSITLSEIIKNKEDLDRIRYTLEMPDLDDVYYYRVSLTNYDYDKEKQYIRLARDYVDPVYWTTFYGNRLQQQENYDEPDSVRIGGSNECLNGRTIGGQATGYFVNDLEVEIYA